MIQLITTSSECWQKLNGTGWLVCQESVLKKGFWTEIILIKVFPQLVKSGLRISSK